MSNPNNWHFLEENIVRSTWLSKEQADEMVARHSSCFPDVTFQAIQADNTNDLPGELELEEREPIEYRDDFLDRLEDQERKLEGDEESEYFNNNAGGTGHGDDSLSDADPGL